MSTENYNILKYKKCDITEKLNALLPTNEMKVKMDSYNSVFTEIINKHAPLKTKQNK